MSMTLLDWSRRVAAMHAEVRASAERDPVGTVGRFRIERDRLFRDHPESPLASEARSGFYAYHPSCAYDPKWSCPLAPPANRLEVPVTAGERL